MKNVILVIAMVMLSRPLWPIVEYMVNYDYIVTKLCENRDEPEMQCNGKCYLTKQLAKEAAGEDKDPLGNNSKKREIQQYIISESLPDFHLGTKNVFGSRKSIAYRPNLYTSLFTSKILHPPRV